MNTPRTASRRPAARPLKSPLAVAAGYALPGSAAEPETLAASRGAAVTERGITLLPPARTWTGG
jgi:hypothetical protein